MLDNPLFKRQFEKTLELRQLSGPRTAFGRRIVELSRAFHFELLSDDVIATYLDELADACEEQLASIDALAGSHYRANSSTATLLEGLLHLSDIFEQLDPCEMEDAVCTLEGEVGRCTLAAA